MIRTRTLGANVKKGVVTTYSKDVAAGVIEDMDGTTFFFGPKDWQSDKPPDEGQRVRFTLSPDGSVQVFFESDG